jgi:hypothetical protein
MVVEFRAGGLEARFWTAKTKSRRILGYFRGCWVPLAPFDLCHARQVSYRLNDEPRLRTEVNSKSAELI